MEHLNRLPTATEMRSEGGEGGDVGRQEKEKQREKSGKGRRDTCKDKEVEAEMVEG